jgi:hypothetical protein
MWSHSKKQPSLQKLFSCLIKIIRHETSVMCLLPEKWYSFYSFLGKFNIRSYFDFTTSQYECHALFIRHYAYSEFHYHLYGLRQQDRPCTYNVTRRRFRATVVLVGNNKYYIYRVSQEGCARLREGVPYVKVHRYNPKHLCPKVNGYGDNGHRKVWSSGGSTHCTCQLTSIIGVRPWVRCHIWFV